MKIFSSSDRIIKISFEEGYHSVIIPVKEKYALCISCQIGCPQACRICISGRSFKRNLSAEEIILQFNSAKEIIKRNPDTVVFMGMGEPSLNLNAVLKAAEYFHNQGLSFNHITISTSCIKNFDKLVNSQFSIAVSIHSPFDKIRKELVNSNKTIRQIINFLKKCTERRNKRIVLIQYAMIKGVNDSEKDLKKLISLDWPKKAMFNLIEFNNYNGFEQSEKENFLKFKQEIIKAGWKCFIRQSRGKEIGAACGMLEN